MALAQNVRSREEVDEVIATATRVLWQLRHTLPADVYATARTIAA
ncbi:hypothetical protein [Micromonospora chokoriensis]|uniref:Uncharacterized protein n=1 Tax=Micromonospora chokoriensis TaxID=356851 RepID=A0A1C4U846_9ACTN|nr:hypothetical protein [Micromonospora chokoriensis]SCE67865.1 hypothetical protein GA0070612_0177 [Micromonospora chokoriensis]